MTKTKTLGPGREVVESIAGRTLGLELGEGQARQAGRDPRVHADPADHVPDTEQADQDTEGDQIPPGPTTQGVHPPAPQLPVVFH